MFPCEGYQLDSQIEAPNLLGPLQELLKMSHQERVGGVVVTLSRV